MAASDKVYDGTSAAVVSVEGARFDYMELGDNLTVSSMGVFNNKNVGTGKAVALTNILGGTDLGNYTVTDQTSTKADITPKALSVDIAAVQTTYGSPAVTGAVSVSGVIGGDVVSSSAAAAQLSDRRLSTSGNLNVGTYVQSAVVSLSGADAGNYTVGNGAAANYVVTPKQITATVTAADKVYDGNTSANLLASGVGIVGADVVTVQGLTGNFSSKNVARDGSGNVVAQAVTVSGAGSSLGGADGVNYTLVGATTVPATSARITPKALTVTGITASDKVYDGTTTAVISVNNARLGGLVGGDSVTLSSQAIAGNFASKNVAFDGSGAVANQAVNVSGVSLSGADAGNYTVSGQSSAQARILQRPVTLTGSVALDKIYDGTTQASVVTGQLGNLVAGESLAVNASGTFEDPEIGSGKAVVARYALANGTNGLASNYRLTNSSEVLRAAILAANLNPVTPVVTPGGGGSGSRVVISGSGSSGAALGVVDEEINDREECSVLHPEKCECEESTIQGIEMCYAPSVVLNNKD